MKFKNLIILFLVSCMNCAFAQKPEKQKVTKDEKRVMVLRENQGGKDYVVKFENDEVVSIKLNGKEVPKKEFSKHQDVINGMVEGMPKAFSDAMNEDNNETGGVKPMVKEREHVIKVAKNQLGQTIITFQPDASEKQFEFVVTGAEDIKMNGDPVVEGVIKVKTVESEVEMIQEDGEKGKKIIIKKN